MDPVFLYTAYKNTDKKILVENKITGADELKMYDAEDKDVGYEMMVYTFPEKIIVKSYSLKFADDSFPVRWYFHAKTSRNSWTLLDNANFVAGDGFTLSPTFDRTGYTKTFDEPYITDSVMILINLSTDTSVKIKEFIVYDEIGVNKPILIPFCTSTNSMYHSGSLNFSQLDQCSIESPSQQADFFAVNHNLLVLENGMGRLEYS